MSTVADFRYHDGLKTTTAEHTPNQSFGRCLLALELGQITMRDLEILRELAYSQYLTRDQIQFLCLSNVSKSVIRRRIEVLTHLALITPVRWEEEREDNTPMHRVAYCLALNGAKLLRHYHGETLPWRPGLAQRHLRRILCVLAANEFYIRVRSQKPNLLEEWQVYTHPIGPVARFSMGGQLVIVEAPREADEVLQINAQRYAKWLEKQPLIFFLSPDQSLASEIFHRLKGGLPAQQLLFSIDERVFNSSPDETGFVWQWDEAGQAHSMALA